MSFTIQTTSSLQNLPKHPVAGSAAPCASPVSRAHGGCRAWCLRCPRAPEIQVLVIWWWFSDDLNQWYMGMLNPTISIWKKHDSRKSWSYSPYPMCEMCIYVSPCESRRWFWSDGEVWQHAGPARNSMLRCYRTLHFPSPNRGSLCL